MLFFLLGFNFAYVQVRTASFREGKSWCKKLASYWIEYCLPGTQQHHHIQTKSYMLKMKSNYAEKAANVQGRYKKTACDGETACYESVRSGSYQLHPNVANFPHSHEKNGSLPIERLTFQRNIPP